MPPKRQAIGRSRSKTRKRKALRASETDEQREARQETDRVRTGQYRSSETIAQRTTRNQTNRLRTAQSRSSETDNQREARQETDRVRTAQSRQTLHADLKLCAFHYNANYDYSLHSSVLIGKMDTLCVHCGALKFTNEPPGMCCANGKFKLSILRPPIEPLLSLISGESSDSKHFPQNIHKYNSAFQMTSFGATKVVQHTFMPTFKIQGQIYHRVGSLLPVPDAEHKFLQIYFMGDDDLQVDQRCHLIPGTRRHIISSLQTFLQENNALIQLFRTAIENMPTDDYTIVIRADKTPAGEHVRRYNAPTINEVAIVMVGEQFDTRDIIIHRRNDTIQRVAETHRSYDALQYPIIFWEEQDGYHFNIMQTNPTTGEPLNKKVSAMSYYAYRIMIRQNETNHILQCCQLYHKFTHNINSIFCTVPRRFICRNIAVRTGT